MEKRVLLLIMDGFGIGGAPDAGDFGDFGANTCQHILEQCPTLNLPTLRRLGLLDRDPKNQLMEINPNKDTLSGISEMFGSILPKMHTFLGEIPLELIQKIESGIGVKTLCGKAGSGTEIMKEWGAEHLRTGFPILYTSQDSVLQLLAHEEVITPSLLYYYCQVVRDMVSPLFPIGRIIARPFVGYTQNSFLRTTRRKDFVLKGQDNPFLRSLATKGVAIFGNRMIRNIFGEELIQSFPGENNGELFQNLTKTYHDETNLLLSLYVIDLEDFDMLFGHRRDSLGFGFALEKMDHFLETFLPLLGRNDLLLITADHGCDPTFKDHTDHTRELVPLIIWKDHQLVEYGHLDGMHHVSSMIHSFFSEKDL
jgi:phosphopentomutase